MNIRLTENLTPNQFKNISSIYRLIKKSMNITLSGPSSTEPASLYALLYLSGKIIGYAEIMDYNNYIEVTAFITPSKQGNGYFNELDSFLSEQYPDMDIYYISDGMSPSVVSGIEKGHYGIQSSEYLFSLTACQSKATGIDIKRSNSKKLFTDMLHDIFYPEYTKKFVKDLYEFITCESNTVPYFLTCDSEIVGCTFITVNIPNAFISSFGILPKYRGKRFGINGIHATINHILDLSARTISVQVSGDNIPAINMYKKAGFEQKQQILQITIN